MNIPEELNKLAIKPDPLKDQFFLLDEKIIKQIVSFAELTQKDVVLEVGAGIGNLTAEIAQKAGRVIAFEIDKRFKPFLDKLPKNVEIHYENAWNYIQLHGKFKKKKDYNKVVASLPYSFVEQFLHNLTFLKYDQVILLVPKKFIKKVEKSGIFSSFFTPKILLEVSKNKFYPIPRTNSVVIDLIKLRDPLENKNLGLFLRQYIYQHEEQLVKNSLMEGLIKYQKLIHLNKLTKNEARKIISKTKIAKNLLEKPPLTSEIYILVKTEFETSKLTSL
jgi:16S rRNA (adenine1518-N6/adenine1519-N6)-dimethyltransferase